MKAKRALCMLAAILLVVAMMLMFLTGCNRQVIDTTFVRPDRAPCNAEKWYCPA